MTEPPDDRLPEGPHAVVQNPDGSRSIVFDVPHPIPAPAKARPPRSHWRRWCPLLIPAAILTAAAVWPVSRGDQAGEVLLAVGTTGVIWWRGR